MDIPTVDLNFFTGTQLKDWRLGRDFLSIIYSYGKKIAPQSVDYGKGWRPLSEKSLGSLESIWSKKLSILFQRKEGYFTQIAISLGDSLPVPRFVTTWVEESFFLREENIIEYLDLSVRIYNLLHPEYGSSHTTEEEIKMKTFMHPQYGRTILPTNLQKGLPGVFWANFFGPRRVEAIGKERLYSVPWFRVTELLDGGLLTLLASSPLGLMITPEQQQELQTLLGAENFHTVINMKG